MVNNQPPGFRLGPIDSRTKATAKFSLSTDAHRGKHSLLIERTNADNGYSLRLKIPTFPPATPPRKLAFVCWTKPVVNNSTGKHSLPHLRWQAFTPAWTGACRRLRATEPDPYAATWGKTAFLLLQSPDVTLKHFRFMIQAKEPGDTILIDNVACYDVTGWSKSDISAIMKHEQNPVPAEAVNKLPFTPGNLLQNSSFELDLSGGWSIPGPTPPEQLRMIDSTMAHQGKSSLRLEFPAKGSQALTGRFRPVHIGQTYTLSAWVRTQTSDTTVTLGFENGYVPQGGSAHRNKISKLIKPDEWQRLEVSGITKAGPADAYGIRIRATGSSAGAVWIDSVQFEEGPARPYAPCQPLEASIHLPNLTGISTWDSPVQYTIQVVNYTSESIEAKLQTQTGDFWGRTTGKITIPQHLFNTGVTKIKRSHQTQTRGSQRLQLYINNRKQLEDEATLTVVPPIRYPSQHAPSRFGQHTKLKPWEMGVAKKLGSCWLRMHDVDFCLSWDQAEPEQGKWVWADRKIDLALQSGFNVLGVLGRTPGWALKPDGDSRKPTGGWFYPSDLKGWANYVETVTRHYRGKIDIWEIWNEPYSFGVYDGTKYSALAHAAYAAANRGNPDCTILGFCTHAGVTAFNRDALAGGTMKACDEVSYHCYTRDGTDAYERGTELQRVLGIKESGKKVWMTEGMGGYTSSWHSYLLDAVNDPYSREPGAPKLSGEKAALTGARAIANILVAGAEKTFWYWSPWESSSALRPDRYTWFEYDGQLKPHAAAYAVAAYFLDGTHSVQRITVGDHLIVCLFERDGDAIAVLWNEGNDHSTISLSSSMEKTKPPIQFFDMMGNPLKATNDKLTINAHPIYVYAEGMAAQKLTELLEKNK